MGKKILILFFLFLIPFSVFALEIDYPSIPGAENPNSFGDSPDSLPLYVKYLFSFAVWGVGFVLCLSFIIGGIRYFLASTNVAETISAREQIFSAFLGLLILLTSVILLQTINPQIINLETQTPAPIEKTETPETAVFTSDEFNSLISTEIPFGKIIEERVLETKAPEEEKREPRMTRIKQVSENFVKLGEMIESQNKDLVNLTKQCSCSQSNPCCEHIFTSQYDENPSESCPDNTCITKPGCTCDPCKNARNEIQKKEEDNLKAIYLGVKIKQKDSKGNEKEIETSIIEEQKKAKEEIRLMEEEIGKLERALLFSLECPIWQTTNLSDFLYSKDYYLEKNWTHETVNFWEAIRVKEDWATLYCRVSGTHWEGGSYTFGGIETIAKGFMPMGLSGDISTGQPTPCTQEIPLGELIDRAQRVGYKLVERLKKLIALSEELEKATQELHVLISQCSSRGPSSDPLRKGCFSICQETVLGVCIKSCQGDPCPDEAINEKLKEITNIVKGIPNEPSDNKKEKEGIKDVVKAKKKNNTEDESIREQIGVLAIIDEVVPKILEDLRYSVRDYAKTCVTTSVERNKLLSCAASRNGIKPDGRLITNCCLTQDYFQECLSQCYLEKGIKDYKKCLNACLQKQAQKKNIESIKDCLHFVNFYCCTI